MLLTKFHGNRSTGSEEGFTIKGRSSHLGHVIQMPGKTFFPPTHGGSTLNLALIGEAVSEMFEHCGPQRIDA